MPADNGLGLDDDQTTSPMGVDLQQHGPEESIARYMTRCLVVPTQHYQLVAECDVLQNQGLMRSQAGEDGFEDDVEQGNNARFSYL